MKAEQLTRTALLNALGMAEALDTIIKAYPEVAQYLPGLASCRKNIEEALTLYPATSVFPDWICNHCGLHEKGGLGKQTICKQCRSNNWRQEGE